jgi:crossover junction endodeoxyribonuclease RuvC
LIYLGIDPGKNGALAIIYEDDTHREFVFDEDTFLYELMALSGKKVKCVLESVHSMPGDSKRGAFSFGENFGYIKGLLKAFRISYELVPPQKWKKEFSVTSDKNTSIEVAQRLFAGSDFRATERCKKQHDGKCEALLMAEYARRNL